MIIGIAHVNLTIPPGTLDLADSFYGETLGFTKSPVPPLQRDPLAGFTIGSAGPMGEKPQQVHIAFGVPSDFEKTSSRHPCFKLE